MSNREKTKLTDHIDIHGGYQYDALNNGIAPQRFWHRKRLETALELMSPLPGERILDVGCGSGVFAEMVAAKGAAQVVGIDSNVDAIRFASAEHQRDNLRFQLATTDKVGFESNSYDRISLLEVVEHIYDEQARDLFAQLYDVLKPGGVLLVSTPNYFSLWPFVEKTMDLLRLAPRMQDDQHVTFYTPRSLRNVVQRAGFTIVEQKTAFIFSPWLSFMGNPLAEMLFRLEQKTLKHLGCVLTQKYVKKNI